MYIFEFTDNKIIIFNKKNNVLYESLIDKNIIKNNKVYDFLKLQKHLNIILDKYNINISIFKVKVIILVFEKLAPSELYLLKQLFSNYNYLVKFVYVNQYFPNNYIIMSGNEYYLNGTKLKKLKNNNYVLIGNVDDFDDKLEFLLKKYGINILELENSKLIIYLTIE